MNSIFSDSTWFDEHCYVTACEDLEHHQFPCGQTALSPVCLITFSSGIYERILKMVPYVDQDFHWPYQTTPLRLCATASGGKFFLHFPSFGCTRIANSLEQLKAIGVQYVIGLGLGGTPQGRLHIGDIVLIEGAVRGDGASRYYAPVEYPAVANFELTAILGNHLAANHLAFHQGLSFGTDALYREGSTLISHLEKLGVLSVDLESSAFLTIGRRLDLKCSWLGVISDRLVQSKHDGNIHSEHVMETLSQLGLCIMAIIDATFTTSVSKGSC